MKIQKIEANETLRPGQLVVTRREWRFLEFIPFPDPETGSQQFQSYRHRWDPVPGTRRPKRRRNFRHPKTANERRASFAAPKSQEHLGDLHLGYTVRKKRSPHRLADLYDDVWIQHQRSWKEHRKNQWKKLSLINREVHAPPFWSGVLWRHAVNSSTEFGKGGRELKDASSGRATSP